jgi:hypothetical protein
MRVKTSRTAIIIAIFSLLALAVPAGVSQTAFAQNIAVEAVEGTLLEGFFDQDQTNTQGNSIGTGDATGSIGQNVEDNSIEAADCGDEALICFGNDLVTDADLSADSSADDNNQGNDSDQDQAATNEPQG